MSGPSSQAVPRAETQERYHHERFAALGRWSETFDRIADLSGERTVAGLLGLDQLGHFGPQGCELLIRRVVDDTTRPAALAICELGCGLGGVLRYCTTRLHDLSAPVGRTVGVELVGEHCRSAVAINRSFSDVAPAIVNSEAERLAMRSRTFDLVICAGSASHFADMALVLREAHRVLRPGGRLLALEEVSLIRDGARSLSPSFLEHHPPDVFFPASVEARRRQLLDSGFPDATIEDITPWAIALMRDRIKGLHLFRGSVNEIYGEPEVSEIVETLTEAAAEMERGNLMAAIVDGRRPGHA